jgi:DNA-binding winged helix-turn-helix (wHTH) protein
VHPTGEIDYNAAIYVEEKNMTIIFYYKAGVLRSGTGTLELSKQNKLGLEYFCRKAGMLVTKDEFVQICWGNKGVIVSDNTVRQSLFRLRSSLSEVGAPEDTLITQGRNGYILKPGIIQLVDSDNVYEDLIAPTINNDDTADDTVSHTEDPAQPTEDIQSSEPPPGVKQNVMFYVLTGTAFALLFVTGLYFRFLFFTHDISFTYYKDDAGRSFFFSDTIDEARDKQNAIRRISYWLDRNNLAASDRPLIYISADWRDTLSFFSCKSDITQRASDCLSINVIGDNKK